MWWGGTWGQFSGRELIQSSKWHVYSIPEMENIDKALQAKERVGAINSHYNIDFQSMRQMKKSNEFHSRPVEKIQVVWLWAKETSTSQKVWLPYDPVISRQLELALLNSEPHCIIKPASATFTYDVNLVQMCQYRQGMKFNRRDICRVGPPLISDHLQNIKIAGELVSLRDCIPDYWAPICEVNHQVVNLDLSSPEAKKISKLMNDTICAGGHHDIHGLNRKTQRDPVHYTPISIKRIQSWRLWKVYSAKTKEMMASWGKKLEALECSTTRPLSMPLIDTAANEFYLWHGPNIDFAKLILSTGTNFDNRLANADTGMFGAGLYFAQNFSKSNQYAPCPLCGNGSIAKPPCDCEEPAAITEDNAYMMLLCRVAMGHFYISSGDSSKVRSFGYQGPVIESGEFKSRNYDSVLGESGVYGNPELRYREVILYDRALVYPEYVIFYKRA
ncbi:hypothetical protein Pelo_2056 [Pelomyxa schiedti]|nr:hypothetical protein Pelo_2056 [Pelomyxa schiedti]